MEYAAFLDDKLKIIGVLEHSGDTLSLRSPKGEIKETLAEKDLFRNTRFKNQ